MDVDILHREVVEQQFPLPKPNGEPVLGLVVGLRQLLCHPLYGEEL